MRVRTLRLKDFKRFRELTIDLADKPTKIVALVGPNGSGKSSIFDGFDEAVSDYRGRGGKTDSYYQRSAYLQGAEDKGYRSHDSVYLTTDQAALGPTSIYIRSAYRYTPRIAVGSIRALPPVEQDEGRPRMLIEADGRLTENYERLLGRFFGEVYGKEIRGQEWVTQNIEGINAALRAVLDVTVSSLGDPTANKGSLFFDKGATTHFPYENLSAGEKEVVDLVLDLYVKKTVYPNAIICIDEPELHLNTAIQRRLLIELEKLVPDESQLWVATHSVGFLRALQEELREKAAVIDFTGANFDAETVLKPIAGARADWRRIFSTALEDLTGLMAPRRIVYCEGRAEPGANGADQGLDAEILNAVFERGQGDTMFVSAGGNDVARNALLAMHILGKALQEVEFYFLKDRDERSDEERSAFIAEAGKRMLTRREIENYLFDKEVLRQFCASVGREFDEARYDSVVHDVAKQDLKPVQQQIQRACRFAGSADAFKRALAPSLEPGSAVYRELEVDIFRATAPVPQHGNS